MERMEIWKILAVVAVVIIGLIMRGFWEHAKVAEDLAIDASDTPKKEREEDGLFGRTYT